MTTASAVNAELCPHLLPRFDVASGDRFFRLGPAPLAPKPERRLADQDPAQLAEVIRLLAAEPPTPSLAHMALQFPPVTQFVERFRALLRRRSRIDFDQELAGLSRVEQAVAFLALLELRRNGEVAIDDGKRIEVNRVIGAERNSPFFRIQISRTQEARPFRLR